MAKQNKTRILITGFGPFPNQPVNPSAELIGRLAKEFSHSSQVRAVVLPTEYKAGRAKLEVEMRRFAPDVIICFGVAASSRKPRIETRARNYAATERPDAAGQRPRKTEIMNGGPGYLHSRMDHASMAADMNGRLSRDAGDYLCNFIYYNALHAAGDKREAVFIHIPDPARQGRPDMDALARGAKRIVQKLL
jgi:pyroglutamyl-peptidase